MAGEKLSVKAIETVLNAIKERNTHRKKQLLLPATPVLRESCGCRPGGTGHAELAAGADVDPQEL